MLTDRPRRRPPRRSPRRGGRRSARWSPARRSLEWRTRGSRRSCPCAQSSRAGCEGVSRPVSPSRPRHTLLPGLRGPRRRRRRRCLHGRPDPRRHPGRAPHPRTRASAARGLRGRLLLRLRARHRPRGHRLRRRPGRRRRRADPRHERRRRALRRPGAPLRLRTRRRDRHHAGRARGVRAGPGRHVGGRRARPAARPPSPSATSWSSPSSARSSRNGRPSSPPACGARAGGRPAGARPPRHGTTTRSPRA